MASRKNSRFFFIFFLIIMACPMAASKVSATKQDDNPAAPFRDVRVVVIHAYHFGFSWSDSISTGIRSVFSAEAKEAEVKFEFLDTRFCATEAYLQSVKQTLQAKYGDRKVNVVIACDDHALNFMLNYGKDIFPGVPVVFCSVSGYKPEMRQHLKLTGLQESIDIHATVDTALRLHPQTKEIAVILDKSRTGQALKKKAAAVLDAFADRVRIRYLEDFTVHQLQDRLSELPNDTVVLLFIFRPDETGRVLSHEQNLEKLSPYCPFPIYSVWQFYLGHGIVGGRLSNGDEEGELAARMALRIIKGEAAADIPLAVSPVEYMFDFAEMKRFGVDAAMLPKGSFILNMPVSYYETHKKLIWTVISVFLIMAGIIASLIVNISARKRAEHTLTESEKRYRLLADNVTDVIWTSDLDLNMTYYSPSVLRQQGYTAEEAMNRSLEETLTPESLRLAGEVFAEELALEEREEKDLNRSRTLELEIRCKDGGTIWAEAKMSFLRDQNGNPYGIIGITRDISERKRAEAALIASEEKYRQLVRYAPSAIYEIDIRHRKFISFNEVVMTYTGYTHDELMQIDPFALFTENGMATFHEREAMLMQGKDVPTSQEYEIKKKDGSTFWALLNTNYELENGVPVIVRVVAHDITDKKEMDEALRESEEKYRLLFDNASDAIFIAQDQSIKFPNPKTIEVTGYSAVELARMPFADLVHPEDREMVIDRHLKRLSGEKDVPTTYSFRVINKAGDVVLVDISAVIVTWEGRPATLNFARDITLQKKMEAQLQQSQRIESLGTLAGGIAHDFNNLLMGIQGRTSLMLMDLDSYSPFFEHLKGLEDYVKSAADLTKQLLGFARGGKYEVKPTDLNQLLDKSAKMFGRTKKEIAIYIKPQKDLWTVEVDRSQIEQVLLNLYVNAWQSMPGGGELYLETENVMLDAGYVRPYAIEPGKYVKISVTDTGVGMDKKTKDRIFDPFFTTKEMGRGTGLGLASAYGIIKNHNGIINLYSEKDQGTTFNIYLPASEKEVLHEERLAEEILKGKETILLVDDEDMVIDVGKELLERLGYTVWTAQGGKAAVELYKANMGEIDLVILDMIMPDMGGGETYDKLKEINPKIKVLLSSGYSINGQATNILERGCDGFIQKPFNMIGLSQKLRGLLDNE